MLQAMRNKMHGWPSIILLGICVFAMSMFGMESYFTSHDDTFVAQVGEHEISQNDFQDQVNQLRQQLSAQQGDSFDSSAFEKPETKHAILDNMIDQQLLLQANADWGLRVSDKAVRDYIAAIPAFQVNGKFDGPTYGAWLASQRKTPGMFESEIRASMAAQALPQAIAASTIVDAAQVDRFLMLLTQRRDLRYVVLPQPELADNEVSDAQIQAWYQAHQADYMNPEQVSVKYVEVNSADLVLDAAPSDDELRKRYAEEKQRFVQPEQRLVSHILIDVPTNATPAQQKAALAKAEKIAAAATPANFAELARKDSQDLGSKRQGGELGWLEKGVTNAAFESAMFGLAKGEISKPVLSADGYHIIWLRDVRSGEAKPFDEVRDELAQEATAAERDRKYNELAGKMSDNTYQNPSSLEPAAAALDLPIKTTALFTRSSGEGLAANPAFVAAAFSDDVLVQGINSGLIDLGNDHSVVVHIAKHVPAAARPLADVRADVKQRILGKRLATAAEKQADGALARLRKGESLANVANSLGGSVTTAKEAVRDPASNPMPVPAPLLKQAFLLPHPAAADKPQFAAVDLKDGSYGLLAVDKVQPGDLSTISAQQIDGLRQQMAQAYAFETQRELLELLKANTEIKINNKLM